MSKSAQSTSTCPFAYIASAFSTPNHKSYHQRHPASPASSVSSSAMSSAPSTPPLTPSPEKDEEADTEVPTIVTLLRDSKHADPRESLEALDLGHLDLSLPVSTLLREGTARAHTQAETSAGAAALVRGELELHEYIRFLVVLWRIYDALESGLNEHASNPVLAPTYDPGVLARSASIAEDITYLLTLLPESETASSSDLSYGPVPPFPLPSSLADLFMDPPAPLTTYLDHLHALSTTESTAPGLLAHAYVRYLGDLSGGQFIMAKVRKAYNLKTLDGVRFYHFDFQGGAKEGEESRADGKRRAVEVKDWYRKGMDEGADDDETMKATLVKEANLAFALNTYLFSTIRTRRVAAGASYPPPAAVESRRTWAKRTEQLSLVVLTAATGFAVSQYVLPTVTDFAAARFGLQGVKA